MSFYKIRTSKLPEPFSHCTKFALWWSEFAVYHAKKHQKTQIKIGIQPKKPHKTYISPIAIAKQYEKMLKEKRFQSQAELSRELGVSRARVCQFLRLLKLDEKTQQYLLDIQDIKKLNFFSERKLRFVLSVSQKKQ